MHNKSFTVDNVVAVVGGRNIADEYFEAGAETGLVDLDIIVVCRKQGSLMPLEASPRVELRAAEQRTAEAVRRFNDQLAAGGQIEHDAFHIDRAIGDLLQKRTIHRRR